MFLSGLIIYSKEMYMGRLKKLCPILIPVLASIMIMVLFQSVFLLGYVPTASMEPTLKAESLLLGLRLFDEPETGDIIIFHHDGSCLVKRIAACEGDTLIHKNTVATVPENCFYVLGDNTENSHDSRYWDDPFVSYESVIAMPEAVFGGCAPADPGRKNLCRSLR